MARVKENDSIKRDNLMVNIIYEHKGANNCVTAKEICDHLKAHGFCLKERSLNAMITRVKMERKIPICYLRHKGYFWATCKAEILQTVNDMEMMIKALREHIDLLKSFIIE